jgi:hypothetical protein
MVDPGGGLPWDVPEPGERRVAEPAPGLGGQPRRARPSAPARAKASSSAQAGNWVTWPRWARVAVPLLICLLVVSAVGAFASRPRPADDAVAPRAPGTGAASSGATVTGEDALPGEGTSGPTTTSTRPTTTTTAATTTEASAGEVPPTATTAPRPTSTGPPATGPPATDSPPTSSGNAGVRPGGPCSPEGATALASSGAPMVCSAVKCDGSPNDQPRWRRATC